MRLFITSALFLLALAGCQHSDRAGFAPNPAPSHSSQGQPSLPPEGRYCQQQGGSYFSHPNPSGGTMAFCRFPSGESCDALQYYKGNCSPNGVNIGHPFPEDN